ncbi:MAG TPA: 2-oxoacid:acceptor oxidoreductase subunit alpha [Candidatus Peribacteraceae bacterium]|nr:2-oxoacid:acceptor oxidoreductase subunit alpha [Candidatus Peribacteraceae bacterium]
MSRASLKIVGASGQGLISIGEILAKAFKRSGYCVFGYREYNSLIKGGHGSYQIDVSDSLIQSSEETVDVLLCLNHHGFEYNLHDVKDGGLILHDTATWKFSKEDLAMFKKKKIAVQFLPIEDILKKLKAKPILGNVLFSSFVWAAFGGDIKLLKLLVGERFAKKKDLLDLNMRCIDEGFAYQKETGCHLASALPKADKKWKDHLLLTGSQAMGMGIVHAGCRLYAGYPMTPSSPLLSYIAEVQNETGMAIKQAEDEITAAQMMSGGNFMGTRAITATSGGGFDLMSETLSLDGMIENPSVYVLAQRPGPATGLPTWTAQGDLLMAVNTSHGEFARCVMSASDSEDAFHLMPEAFNIAEEFQTPVIVLTDKHIAEGIYTQKLYDQKKTKIRRGKLIVKAEELKKVKSSDRFDPTAKDGISKRWLPGAKAATYNAQADEHSPDGSVDESAHNAVLQMEKRMRKMDAMKQALPEPELFISGQRSEVRGQKDQALDLLIVSWGSNKGVILDVLQESSFAKKKIGYLHYTYMWPLKTERFEALSKKAKHVVFIECNYQAQLLQLLRMQCGTKENKVLLKYDGRPFFYHELKEALMKHLP